MRLLKLMSNFLVLLFVVLSNPYELPGLETTQDLKAKIEKGVASGEIAYRLTEPAEIRLLLGAPQSESETRDGGMLILEFVYPLISVMFSKMKDDPAPFVLRQISVDGKKIGVAPGASLTYFAVPMCERDNSPYIESLKKIFDLNQTLPEAEKIRVVSISTGDFKAQPHYEEWKEMLGRAEKSGILVVTCDQADPKITPSLIIRYLIDTSFKTESGPVINPQGFIDLIRRGNQTLLMAKTPC